MCLPRTTDIRVMKMTVGQRSQWGALTQPSGSVLSEFQPRPHQEAHTLPAGTLPSDPPVTPSALPHSLVPLPPPPSVARAFPPQLCEACTLGCSGPSQLLQWTARAASPPHRFWPVINQHLRSATLNFPLSAATSCEACTGAGSGEGRLPYLEVSAGHERS